MIGSALGSACHILGVALAFSVVVRGVAFGHVANGDRGALADVFRADNVFGISALLLIGSGLFRAFGGLEKGTYFYLHNGFFMVKMTVLLLLMGLEMWPMCTLISWRIKEKRQRPIDDATLVRRAAQFRVVCAIETVALVLLIFIAPLMVRAAWMLV